MTKLVSAANARSRDRNDVFKSAQKWSVQRLEQAFEKISGGKQGSRVGSVAARQERSKP